MGAMAATSTVWARSFAITLAVALLTIQPIASPTMTAAPAPIAVPHKKPFRRSFILIVLTFSRGESPGRQPSDPAARRARRYAIGLGGQTVRTLACTLAHHAYAVSSGRLDRARFP